MIIESIVANKSLKVREPAAFNRIAAFDFTKGALVLFMVLFHWLNYFYGPYGEIYKYLRFLTPSFIFIAGFLISYVHFAKYEVGSSKLSKRLALRGIKLIGLFVALNVLVSPLVPESFLKNIVSGRSVMGNLDTIFLTAKMSSSGVSKIASFNILVPIGYLLILAAMLSRASQFFTHAFHAACALILLCMIILDLHGIQSANAELVTVGLLGVVFGYIPRGKLQEFASHPWVIVFAYCAYLVIITIWDVSLYVQMVGACLTTALIYVVGVQVERPGRLRFLQQLIVLLGKYSLFGYVSQIAILQLLKAGLRGVNPGYGILGASFVAALTLTILSVEAIDSLRVSSRALDGIYRAVFA